ncbi:MAG: hypothetical protein M0036_15455 [Desulfobacteraceae bacterium]|nr:hypothetical protein [Desulfobacteraceae bacterium]
MNSHYRPLWTYLKRSMTAIWVLLCLGCAHQFALPEEPRPAIYTVVTTSDSLIRQWAPAFVAHGYADEYNRIGRPTADGVPEHADEVWIDTARPTVYFLRRTFTTEKATYTNLIYRVHFPKVPYSLTPFNLTAGDNGGLIVVVTLDADNRPLLVTTVHTCGCYKAFVPTDLIPAGLRPEGWDVSQIQSVYGERLPSQLNYNGLEDPVLIVDLRPGVHRVMSLAVVPARQITNDRYIPIAMTVEPMAALEQLPSPQGTTSFYYDQGWREGHVKGSIKPFEMIFLSLISLDLFVGSDKDYADPAITDNPFYTSLKPWRRHDSDMWDFARFLHYWGWRF